MTAATTAATDVWGVVLDTASAYFQKNGSANAGSILGVLSGDLSEVNAAFNNNPALEVAAVTVGLFAVVALGPTATVATAVEAATPLMEAGLASISPSLVSYAAPMAEAVVNYVIAQSAESFYTNLNTVVNSIVSNLGGTTTSSTSSGTSTITTTTSTFNPNVVISSAPDSSGNTPQLLINLPLTAQDSGSVSVITQGSSSVSAGTSSTFTPGTPAYQTDESTGSTIGNYIVD